MSPEDNQICVLFFFFLLLGHFDSRISHKIISWLKKNEIARAGADNSKASIGARPFPLRLSVSHRSEPPFTTVTVSTPGATSNHPDATLKRDSSNLVTRLVHLFRLNWHNNGHWVFIFPLTLDHCICSSH